MSSRGTETIMVAMSGGVDSAVAALCLLRAGHRVEALHMTNWEDDDGYCTAARDYQDARSVCRELGIPLHRVNFAAEYRREVFAHFLAEYRAGRTPNPDVLCNRQIKFGAFLAHARRLGARRIATGHYARVGPGQPARLLRGQDPGKDQSYFLHAVPGTALGDALFPVGGLHKAEVRHLANAAGLPVHAKRDSTGICFIGERPFREFLGRFVAATPGAMETPEGQTVGAHQGLPYYTIGQRQGLEIGGIAGRPDEPWYVAAKDAARNILVVVQGHDHPCLLADELVASQPHWVAGDAPSDLLRHGQLRCVAQTRYRQPAAACTVYLCAANRLRVAFDSAQWAVSPGQYVVFYAGDECLGGATIDTAAGRAADAEPLAQRAAAG